ncbi:F-box-like domain superfamily [Arabidopsis thaliana x Arabidopsis arenosa]|uniref:F-box domain-containing protein n=2 Tax=Arabidopsis TaxID=3701 RepID=A0A178UVW3_ARATH|nr:F-box-like domain superfamily [Arabidopsis thaliana x Arabidopsis arenosa]OAO97755.1 hypothetical protein AXX17_AT4G10980 [Arabidopsis thaliana]
MTTICDLPRDLVARILSRVPLTSMRRVRFTCKRWNTISKDPSFAKTQFGKAARQFIMMSQSRVSLMSVKLHGDGNEDELADPYIYEGYRFGPRLPLPFHSYNGETVTLSSVREEQLAVLYQQDTCLMEIWVTNKIEPDVVSWSKVFLAVDMEPLTGSFIPFAFFAGSFFIDEEKKIAVVFDKDQEEINDRAYLIGENGYYKEVDLGYMNGYYQQQVDPRGPDPVFPLVCSYSPSLVTIPQGTRGKRKERDY